MYSISDFEEKVFRLVEFISSNEEEIDIKRWLRENYKFQLAYEISKSTGSFLTIDETEELFFFKAPNSEDFNNNKVDYFIKKAREIWREYLITDINDENHSFYKEQLWWIFYKLELINIARAIDYVDISKNRELYQYLSVNWLDFFILIQIHKILTYWFDEILRYLKENKYYNSWEFRKEENALFVWWNSICSVDEMYEKLHSVFNKFNKVNSIFDVYEIHWLIYSAHPFYDGNKRMSRIIENLTMNYYNFTNGFLSTTGYYILEKNYTTELVENCVRWYNKENWIETAKSSTLISLYDEILFLIILDLKNIFEIKTKTIWNNKYPTKLCFSKNDVISKLEEDFKLDSSQAFSEAWEIINYLFSLWILLDVWDGLFQYNIDSEEFWDKYSILEEEIEDFFYNNYHLVNICNKFLFTKKLIDTFIKLNFLNKYYN